ncbi:hypothetical protein GJU40_18050 [Bacillus lacus]|uniref:Uncharacterized protein n=1 Tax=Metabacillus lacus TaxID=1983721 RepID=A0A7X2J212_9BACI|nr:hypothetical protein [Metabacillus lacus]MRX74028.1 hypothetical protein [Metabacillus lacus]
MPERMNDIPYNTSIENTVLKDLKQLSLKYPNLKIAVTSEIDESIKLTGRLNLIIKNGKYVD